VADPFRTTRLVEFADTDMAGIAHFASFFRFMEAAEHAFLRSLGLSVFMEVGGEKLTFPRVSASCDYLRPVRFEDVLDIAVRVERLGKSSVTYLVEFSHAGQPVARGRLTTACCRVGPDHQIRAVPIPEPIRSKLQEGGDVSPDAPDRPERPAGT
jgi:acyl-CoA thioester hydrolase